MPEQLHTTTEQSSSADAPWEHVMAEMDNSIGTELVLGHEAVRLNAILALDNIVPDSAKDADDRAVIESARPQLAEALKTARAELENMNAGSRFDMNERFYMNAQSAWLNNLLGLPSASDEWSRWSPHDYVGALIAKDESGQYSIADGTFQNVLEWHNYEKGQIQNELDGVAPDLRANFVNKIENAISSGILPKNARDNLQRLADTPFLYADPLSSIDIGGAAAMALHTPDGYAVMMKSTPDGHFENGSKTITHELLHVIEGGDDGLDVFDNEFVSTAINEASVEHTAQAIEGLRNIDDFDSHDTLDGSYRDERYLLENIIDGDPVKLQQLMEVYFSNDDRSIKTQNVKRIIGDEMFDKLTTVRDEHDIRRLAPAHKNFTPLVRTTTQPVQSYSGKDSYFHK